LPVLQKGLYGLVYLIHAFPYSTKTEPAIQLAAIVVVAMVAAVAQEVNAAVVANTNYKL
jgi:hypothetical protein